MTPRRNGVRRFTTRVTTSWYRARGSCRSEKDRRYGSNWSGLTDALLGGWQLGGIINARTGLPITVIDGRARSLQGERGSERPNCVGDWKPDDQTIDRWLDIIGLRGAPHRHLRQLRSRRRPRARLQATSTWWSRSASRSARPRYGEFRVEAFNVFNITSFGPPARDINDPANFRPHHQHDQLAPGGGAGVQALLLAAGDWGLGLTKLMRTAHCCTLSRCHAVTLGR